MKTIRIITILFVIAGVFVIAASAAEDQNKGAEEMTLNGGRKGDIDFPHLRHQESLTNCMICHNMFPQKAGVIDTHKAEGKLKSKQVMNKLCISCHRAMDRDGKTTGPTSCSKCHVK